MEQKKASDYFHGCEKYNCAQAVVKSLQEVCRIPDAVIDSFHAKGSGKADGGICGSVYAVRSLLKETKDLDRFNAMFIEKAGSLTCKEIRKLKFISCAGTTDLASEIVQKIKKEEDEK
ncbi:MAG: C-GCAxxG-C-C family (seleno)protein [bacterium]